MTQATLPLIAQSHGHAVAAVMALQAAGIPASLADEHIQGVYAGLDFGAFRPRILVPPACEAEARSIIAQAQTAAETPLYPCPDCGGETVAKARPLLATIARALTGRLSQAGGTQRYCSDCDGYNHVPDAEPFTAEELGYPPIR
jgi:hypothetical protein